MKNIIQATLVSILICGVIFLFMAFVNLTFDISLWSKKERILTVCLFYPTLWISTLFIKAIEVFDKKENEKTKGNILKP